MSIYKGLKNISERSSAF